jgi:hypothetical protein
MCDHSRTHVHAKQVNWIGGHIYILDASVFENSANGTLAMNAAAGWYPSPTNGPGSLINYGTISKSSQSSTISYVAQALQPHRHGHNPLLTNPRRSSVTFNNYGVLSCTGGILNFNTYYTSTNFGLFDVQSGATLAFPGGSFAHDVASTLQGQGAVVYSGM